MKVEDVAKPKDPATPQPSGTGVPNGPPPNPDFERLVRLVHADPHTVLGTHPVPGGVAVRAFRPNATAITVHPEGLPSVEMKRVHQAGIFEAVIPGRRDLPPYRFEVRYADGKSFTLRDPYAHLPQIGQMDLHLAGEGRHERIQDRLGAHPRVVDGVPGVSFAVWAPNSRSVSVVGSFNGWDGRLHPMRSLGTSGIWELFIPDIRPGALYKWEIRTGSGNVVIKADPYARYSEVPPGTASIVFESKHAWGDVKWMDARKAADPLRRPLSIYEVHLGSWRRVPEDGDRSLTFREIGPMLADYVIANGFTHVQLMPVMEHPFGGSWGYQVTGYFATTSRMGNPDDFRWFVDHLHQRGIGVIADWVPAHFPKDAWALGRFNGEALYEHLDPRLGEHPDWGTYIFNFGRNEVRNFLLASALFWLEEFHLDGLRVDAVASMLYLDYSRKDGEWIPNRFGGRENLEAITFIKEMNELAHAKFPGTLMIAEESTAWPGVSRPTYAGGLGFGFKWNMGWMHDTLSYFEKDPIHRRYHHNNLTFGMLYAWSENFVLPLSHDEVVHGKKSLIDKMPGDRWQKFANLRALYAYMWAHPGKKMIFMGDELGQWREWSEKHSLDWDVLQGEDHAGVQRLIKDLNGVYQAEPALWEADHETAGFEWIDANNADENVIAFRRMAPKSGRQMVCVCNFSPQPRTDYRIGLPKEGEWREVINTDATGYGGANVGNAGAIHAKPTAWHGKPFSAVLTLPPLAVLWFSPV